MLVNSSAFLSEISLTFLTGTRNLPQNRKRQDPEEDISGNREPSKGLRILPQKEGLQESWHISD
jgi:hypothetical protein